MSDEEPVVADDDTEEEEVDAEEDADEEVDDEGHGSQINRPELFIMKSKKNKRQPAESVKYPAKRRTSSLPHTCHFPGLKVPRRVIERAGSRQAGEFVVRYQNLKWGSFAPGYSYNEKKLNKLYALRYLKPFPDFAVNFDAATCFCKA